MPAPIVITKLWRVKGGPETPREWLPMVGCLISASPQNTPAFLEPVDVSHRLCLADSSQSELFSKYANFGPMAMTRPEALITPDLMAGHLNPREPNSEYFFIGQIDLGPYPTGYYFALGSGAQRRRLPLVFNLISDELLTAGWGFGKVSAVQLSTDWTKAYLRWYLCTIMLAERAMLSNTGTNGANTGYRFSEANYVSNMGFQTNEATYQNQLLRTCPLNTHLTSEPESGLLPGDHLANSGNQARVFGAAGISSSMKDLLGELLKHDPDVRALAAATANPTDPKILQKVLELYWEMLASFGNAWNHWVGASGPNAHITEDLNARVKRELEELANPNGKSRGDKSAHPNLGAFITAMLQLPSNEIGEDEPRNAGITVQLELAIEFLSKGRLHLAELPAETITPITNGGYGVDLGVDVWASLIAVNRLTTASNGDEQYAGLLRLASQRYYDTWIGAVKRHLEQNYESLPSVYENNGGILTGELGHGFLASLVSQARDAGAGDGLAKSLNRLAQLTHLKKIDTTGLQRRIAAIMKRNLSTYDDLLRYYAGLLAIEDDDDTLSSQRATALNPLRLMTVNLLASQLMQDKLLVAGSPLLGIIESAMRPVGDEATGEWEKPVVQANNAEAPNLDTQARGGFQSEGFTPWSPGLVEAGLLGFNNTMGPKPAQPSPCQFIPISPPRNVGLTQAESVIFLGEGWGVILRAHGLPEMLTSVPKLERGAYGQFGEQRVGTGGESEHLLLWLVSKKGQDGARADVTVLEFRRTTTLRLGSWDVIRHGEHAISVAGNIVGHVFTKDQVRLFYVDAEDPTKLHRQGFSLNGGLAADTPVLMGKRLHSNSHPLVFPAHNEDVVVVCDDGRGDHVMYGIQDDARKQGLKTSNVFSPHAPLFHNGIFSPATELELVQANLVKLKGDRLLRTKGAIKMMVSLHDDPLVIDDHGVYRIQ